MASARPATAPPRCFANSKSVSWRPPADADCQQRSSMLSLASKTEARERAAAERFLFDRVFPGTVTARPRDSRHWHTMSETLWFVTCHGQGAVACLPGAMHSPGKLATALCGYDVSLQHTLARQRKEHEQRPIQVHPTDNVLLQGLRPCGSRDHMHDDPAPQSQCLVDHANLGHACSSTGGNSARMRSATPQRSCA